MKNWFDYKHTCPEINNEIETAKDRMKDFLDNLVYELSPKYYDTEHKDSYVESVSKDLYENISGMFESVRSTNEDMRNAAENQIVEMHREYEDLKDQIEELKTQLRELE